MTTSSKLKHFSIFACCLLAVFFASRAKAANFTLTAEDQEIIIEEKTVASFTGRTQLQPFAFSQKDTLTERILGLKSLSLPNQTIKSNLSEIYNFLKEKEAQINREVVEPKLIIKNNRAEEFNPPLDGLKMDPVATAMIIANALNQKLLEAQAVTKVIRPQTPLALTNNLGITALLARGVSSFSGSPANRRHNIKVGVEKFKGLIIKQGEEFSFNKYLGPVEAKQGFLPELVIKKTGTVPELGGGLCQVSSTTFRAAINSGLPITQRKNHAYAVVYYAPQGTDATIYPGVVDLKFINDTPGNLLIWPYLKDNNTLVFEFYGTPDGRKISVEKPVQFDKKPDGSMKATWERTVTKNGTTLHDVFKSVYASPALFHKTEEFVSASPPAPAPLAPASPSPSL